MHWELDIVIEKCPIKPGTTKPLPETGSELMILGLSILSIASLGILGYRRVLNK